MAIYAIIENSIVINIVEWDGVQGWAPPDGCIAIRANDESVGGIGDKYDSETDTFIVTRNKSIFNKNT